MFIEGRRGGFKLFVSVLLGSVFLTGCVSQEQYARSLRDNDQLRKIVDDQGKQLQVLQDQNADLRQKLGLAQENAVDPEWRRRQEEAMRLLEGLRGPAGATSDPDFDVVARPEGIAFEIKDGVLFASGQAQVTAKGRETLDRIRERLMSSGNKIRVEGHTDTDPIVNSPWDSNLHLSAARALAVAELLIKLGVPADRISMAGYGEYKPLESGDSDAAKKRNRRVEVLVLNGS